MGTSAGGGTSEGAVMRDTRTEARGAGPARRGAARLATALCGGLIIGASALALPAAAADYPSGGPNPVVPNESPTPPTRTTGGGGGGTLPFTGGDAVGLAGIGAALVGGGVLLQRRSRARSQA
jgi:hypothetical protein